MLGLDVKRGVEATCERVFIASGNQFSDLTVLWGGKTACINYTKDRSGAVRATIVLPALDETKAIPQPVFNNMVGFVIHELGHAWFTDNAPWDSAVHTHKDGKYIGMMINGLEDPRIEQCVIDSGFAPNSFPLFDSLIGSLLSDKGYVKEINKQTLPFVLCIEGRRLNHYRIDVPDLLVGHEYEPELRSALQLAKEATSTNQIVKIATNLYDVLFPESEVDEGGEGEEPPINGDFPVPSDEPPTDKPTEEGGEGGDEGGDDGDEGEPTDKGKDKPKGGGGKPTDERKPLEDRGGDPRDVEPNDHIKTQLGQFGCKADARRTGRPSIKKVEVLDLEKDWS
jgi:hypothetical protein